MVVGLHSKRQVFAIGAAGIIAALARPSGARAQTRDIADTLARDPRFSRFLNLIVQVSLTDDLRSHGPLTLFAPTNEAFEHAGAATQILAGGARNSGESSSSIDSDARSRITTLIQAHIVRGNMSPDSLVANTGLRTNADTTLSASNSNGTLTIANPSMESNMRSFFARAGHQMSHAPARVILPGLPASNGVIYPVSEIIWP